MVKTCHDFILKKILKKEFSSEAFLNISLLTLPFFIFFIYDINFDIPTNIYLLIIIRSFFVVAGGILFNLALKNSDLSVVAPFYNLSPIFVIIVSSILLGERLILIEYFGIALMILGSLLLKNEDVSINDHNKFVKSKYFAYVIVCLVLWAISATLTKPIVNVISSINALFFSMLFSVIFLLLFQVIKHNNFLKIVKDLKKDWKIVSIAAVTNFIYSILYFMALSHPSAKVSIIIPLFRFYVFLEVLIGGEILKEKHFFKKLSASAIMLIGVIVMVLT